MEYPKAVLEKAERLEQLVLRVSAGENLEEVTEALGLKVTEKQLAEIKTKYEASGKKREVLIDGRYGHAQKVDSEIREWLYRRKETDEKVRSPQMAREIEKKFGVVTHPGHLNYLLRKRGLSGPVGRPYKEKPEEEEKEESNPEASKDNAGIFFPGRGEGRVRGGGSDRGNGGGGSG